MFKPNAVSYSVPFDPYNENEIPWDDANIDPDIREDVMDHARQDRDEEIEIFNRMRSDYDRLQREEEERWRFEGDNFQPRYSFRDVDFLYFI